MNSSEKLGHIILFMREYQKINGISGKCVINAKYLYDTIKHNFKNPKMEAKAVVVVGYSEAKKSDIFICGHLVVLLEGKTVLDPSYEIHSLTNKKYYMDLNELFASIDHKSKKRAQKKFRTYIGNPFGIHRGMTNVANHVNSGFDVVDDYKYYNDQADYVEKRLKDL